MKNEMFDRIVKARADERVQKRIKKFKRTVGEALGDLGGTYKSLHPEEHCQAKESRAILAIMGSDNPSSGWPKILWERECKAVKNELLGIMDEMQKALLAADRAEPGEHTPEVSDGT